MYLTSRGSFKFRSDVNFYAESNLEIFMSICFFLFFYFNTKFMGFQQQMGVIKGTVRNIGNIKEKSMLFYRLARHRIILSNISIIETSSFYGASVSDVTTKPSL